MAYMKIGIADGVNSIHNLENLAKYIKKRGFEVVFTLHTTSVPVQVGLLKNKPVFQLELGLELIVEGDWEKRKGLVEYIKSLYDTKCYCIDVGGPIKKEDYHNVGV